MTPMFLRACGVAAALGVSMAAFAQTTGQQPAPPQPRTQTTPASPQAVAGKTPQAVASQTVTVEGCIQAETDYRKAQNLGRGGALGTGAGAGNEFVLADAKMASAGAATGTTGAAAQAYELSGANEGKAAQFAGKRVEITGTLKPAEIAGTAPTGGPTAGPPPRGVDVASDDLKLRELEVASVRETTGTCSAR